MPLMQKNQTHHHVHHHDAPPAMATNNQTSSTGPHRHNWANKLDPTVDSGPGIQVLGANATKHGNTAAPTTSQYEPHHQAYTEPHHNHAYESSGTTSHGPSHMSQPTTGVSHGQTRHTQVGSGAPEGTYGPHNSRLANAVDPRVDSDRDGRAQRMGGTTGTMGTTGTTHAHAGNHAHTTGGGVMGSSHPHTGNHYTATGGVPEGTYGQHNSRLANAADPRIDSDHDGRAQRVGGTTGATHHTSHHVGAAHQPRTAVVSNGPAPKTSGPHKSDMMNKLDPSVDSKAGVVERKHY